jgi:hypothetical protein
MFPTWAGLEEFSGVATKDTTRDKPTTLFLRAVHDSVDEAYQSEAKSSVDK